MPKIFKSIGQEHVYAKLLPLIQNGKIGSGYLFSGPEGSGKLSVALNFAAALNCLSPEESGLPCGSCSACQKMRSYSHPNIFLIYALPRNPGKDYSKNVDPIQLLSEKQYEDLQSALEELYKDPYNGIHVVGANKILINSVRKLKQNLNLKSNEEGWQTVIIYLAEKANNETFNSLLKILEEPPQNTTFIITTEKFSNIPVTIRSRCQIIKFNSVPENYLRDYISENGVDDKTSALVAKLCNGNVRKMHSYMEVGEIFDREEFVEFWRDLMRGKMFEVNEKLKKLTTLAKSDPRAYLDFFRMMIYWFRDAQMMANGRPESELILAHFETEIIGFANYYPGLPYHTLIENIEQVIELTAKNLYIPALIGRLFITIQSELENARKRMKSKP